MIEKEYFSAVFLKILFPFDFRGVGMRKGVALVALLRISSLICLSVLAPVFLLSQRTQINGGGEEKSH